MKIAVWHNLPSGGAKRALFLQVRELVKRGHHIEAWCPSTADQTYLPLRDLVPEHVLPFSWHPRSQPTRFHRFVSEYADTVGRIETYNRHLHMCARQINQGEFDLLFANTCYMLRAAPIGRFVKFPKVLYLQEPYRPFYEATPRLPWLALEPEPRWYAPTAIKAFLRDLLRVQAFRVQAREEWKNAVAFDSILVNSLFSRESILRAYGLEAQVCYLGVDTSVFSIRHRAKEDFVLGVGNFFPHKNIDFVIRAISQIPHPRPRLVWVGNATSPYQEEMNNLARALDVVFEPRVLIGDEQLVELYNRARMVALAPRLEPFGLVPLEANACGTPVVAVAEGGLRETVINKVNGLLVNGDPSIFARAIQQLMQDQSLADRLGENGRQLVLQKWSIDKSVDQLESILQARVNPGKQDQ